MGKDKLAIEGGPPAIQVKLPTIKDASGRLVGNEELEQLKQVIQSGTLAYIYGTKVNQFEKDFSKLMGMKNAVAMSSGTAALHTAIIYLNPEPGDEIIVSPITDMGAIIPMLYQMAIPVFVDIDPITQNIDPKKIEEKITPRTKAIMVTHIFGGPADMDPIMQIARKHNLFVIEDCAQAHMAEYKGKLVGTIGHIGCFSFQQSKHITTGDGGMVISNEDDRFGRNLRLCMDKGWPRHVHGRDHYFLAPNYHMTELQAAVGIAQIKKYDISIKSRRVAADLLSERLTKELNGATPVRALAGCKHTFFYFTFRIDRSKFSVGVERIVDALKAEGLPCELGYPGPIPLYLYPMIKDKKTFGNSGWPFNSPATKEKWDFKEGLCPIAETACKETIILPWNEGLKEEHVNLIFNAIRKVLSEFAMKNKNAF